MRSGASLNVEPPIYPVRSPIMTGAPVRPPVSGPGLGGGEVVSVLPPRLMGPPTPKPGAAPSPSPGIRMLGLPVVANNPSGSTPTGCSSCEARAQTAANFITSNWLLFAVAGVVVLFFVLHD